MAASHLSSVFKPVSRGFHCSQAEEQHFAERLVTPGIGLTLEQLAAHAPFSIQVCRIAVGLPQLLSGGSNMSAMLCVLEKALTLSRLGKSL